MRIEVDRRRCQGNGACAAAAPDVFRLDGEGRLVVLQERPGDDLRRSVARAARRCPTQAITVSA